MEKILSGDDDLFLQKISSQTDWNVQCCSDINAIVSTYAPVGYKHFTNQRKRHISAAKHFRFPVKISYTIYFLSKLILMVIFLSLNCISGWVSITSSTSTGLFLLLLIIANN